MDVPEDVADAADPDSARSRRQVHVLEPLRVVDPIVVVDRDTVIQRAVLVPFRRERHVRAGVQRRVAVIASLEREIQALPRVRLAADPAAVRERLTNDRAAARLEPMRSLPVEDGSPPRLAVAPELHPAV